MPVDVTELVVITCGACGVSFGLTEVHREALKREGGGFYCPNGHSRTYGDSEATRLKRQLSTERDAKERALRQRDEEAKAHTATKGLLTKARKRAEAGVCPHCNRSFVQLARHVKSKHPDHAR